MSYLLMLNSILFATYLKFISNAGVDYTYKFINTVKI